MITILFHIHLSNQFFDRNKRRIKIEFICLRPRSRSNIARGFLDMDAIPAHFMLRTDPKSITKSKLMKKSVNIEKDFWKSNGKKLGFFQRIL